MSDYKIQTLLGKSEAFLREKKVSGNHRLEAELLLADVLGVDRIQLILKREEVPSSDQVNLYREYIVRRSKHEPVAYILGYKEFLNLRFKVDSNVLIPRPETEELCAWILERYPSADLAAKRARLAAEEYDPKAEFSFGTDPQHELEPDEPTTKDAPTSTLPPPKGEVSTAPGASPDPAVSNLHVADIGTGSGCIGIALQKSRPAWKITMSDVSQAALDVARSNYHTILGRPITDAEFLHSDYFQNFANRQMHYDILVSNPPYIATAEQASIMPDVRDFEPSGALFIDDPEAGLQKLLGEAFALLKNGGELYIEHSEPYLAQAVPPAKQCGYTEVEVKKDMFGKDRFLRLRK